MTITAPARPTRDRQFALVGGCVTGGVSGASLASFVVGTFIESVALCVMGLVLPAVYGLLLYLAGAPRRARDAAIAPRTALAMIESLRAVGGETGDIPVRFDLTVAPENAPAYRVEFTQSINLAHLSDYRPRGIVVVQYPPDRSAKVRIVERPTPEWESRVVGDRLDSAPGSAMVSEPSEGGAFALAALVGLLLGAAVVILLFRTDLFGKENEQSAERPSSSTSSSSSTTVNSSESGTVTLGPGQSLLDQGALRRAIDSLTQDKGTRPALTVVVRERVMSVVFVPTGTEAPRFDPRSLPYERFPALVKEAETRLGAGTPQTWQLTADRLTGSLVIRVDVTGTDGTASLEADGQGKVVRSTPAH